MLFPFPFVLCGSCLMVMNGHDVTQLTLQQAFGAFAGVPFLVEFGDGKCLGFEVRRCAFAEALIDLAQLVAKMPLLLGIFHHGAH